MHEPDSMMEQDMLQLKFLRRRGRDQSHLMFRHFHMRLVVNSFDLATVFQFSNNSLKIDNRSGRHISVLFRRL